MKGLLCSNLERKEEAYEFIKLGLRNDLTSHICKLRTLFNLLVVVDLPHLKLPNQTINKLITRLACLWTFASCR